MKIKDKQKPDVKICVELLSAQILVCIPTTYKDCDVLQMVGDTVPFGGEWQFCFTEREKGKETHRVPCNNKEGFDHIILTCGDPLQMTWKDGESDTKKEEGKTDETNPNN